MLVYSCSLCLLLSLLKYRCISDPNPETLGGLYDLVFEMLLVPGCIAYVSAARRLRLQSIHVKEEAKPSAGSTTVGAFSYRSHWKRCVSETLR